MLSGTRGDTMIYEKVMFSCSGRVINSFALVYPIDERHLYDPIVEGIEDSFRPGNAGCDEHAASSDVLWRPVAPKRYRLVRWIVGFAAVAAALALINGGMPREPDIALPLATPHLDRTPSKDRVEPVRILNPSRRSAPVLNDPPMRLPAAERITANPSAPVPMRRAPTDYQDLRRELLNVE